jgi:glycosyltransferase involved in cell wall biosynthesis
MSQDKKILIFSSEFFDTVLLEYITGLNSEEYKFYLYGRNLKNLEKLNAPNIFTAKLYLPDLNKKLCALFFIIFSPVWYLLVLAYLLSLKIKNIKTIIYVNSSEKIIFTPLAKLLGFNNIWIECPDANLNKLAFIAKKIYLIFSSRVKILVFADITKKKLIKLGAVPDRIILLTPGIKLNNYQRQENIFVKLAQTEQAIKNHKYFTIGTVANLNDKNKVELFFQAAKNCLTVIPNLQLIVIGDGKARKPLVWLAKKMEIDNLIWFVGEQNFLRKWFDALNIYVYTDELLCLNGIKAILNAMSAGLPVIGPRDIGLEDFIFENKNGLLVERDNNEELAQAIIKLKQNRRLYDILGQNGKQIVAEKFQAANTINILEGVINKQIYD